ncbi:hypothetical protein J5N97_029643 [Dioscorea zingiberensis]|uniref:Lipoyl-binding domain-containing protein n=1 Tax=Dioscorea zingiberensis TaxID=325984 RepID=A0A9D5H3A7_9LILI|nr:hypothetical protein J5N97_029643 [Dioscorea zingiberensis]
MRCWPSSILNVLLALPSLIQRVFSVPTRGLGFRVLEIGYDALWASSAANALKISCIGARAPPLPAFSLSRCFSSILDGLKYSSSHEWVKHEGVVATVGITDHAQGHLGEVVFVQLPESGTPVNIGGSFGAVESVKATSDANSPISGEVIEVNTKLSETPRLIIHHKKENQVKPSSPSELDSLMGQRNTPSL